MRRFALLVVAGWVSAVAVAACPSCINTNSSACRPWGNSKAFFQWAGNNSASSNIVLTAGPCGQAGESATGYILSVTDKHSFDCDNNYTTNPCNGNTTDAGTFAVIRIDGNQKAFEHIFPDGISFLGDYPVNNGWSSIVAKQIGCKYSLQLSSPASSRMIVTAAVSQCLSQYSGSLFTIDVRIYQKRDVNNEVYSYISNTSGTISVRNNPRTSFDPQNFIPDVRSGTALGYIETVTETYRQGGDSRWMLSHTQGWSNYCEQYEDWLAGNVGLPSGMICNEQGYCQIPAVATTYRVKYPGFQEVVSGCPPYIAAEGWEYNIGSTQNGTYISYKMGSGGTLFFVCNSPADNSGSQKYYISKVVYSPNGVFNSSANQEKWHCVYSYNSPAKLHYIHTGSDPNDPNNMSTTGRYYQYDWSNGNKDVAVTYHDNADSSKTRQWSVKFDDKQRAIQYQSGSCSSGCGSAEFDHVEYHSDYDDLITKRYNANNQVILENTYNPIFYGEWVDAGWIAVYNGSFELPDVSTCTDQTDIPFWTISNTNTNDVPEICDIGQAPDGSQILRPNGDTLTEILPDRINRRMSYTFKASVRATPGDNQPGTAQIKLFSNAYSNALVTLPYTETDTEWHPLEGTWDGSSYLGPDNTDPFKVVLTGQHVEIDNIQLSSKVYVENQTKPILIEQQVYDPNTNTMQVAFHRDICKSEAPQPPAYWIFEKTYIKPNQYRLTKVVYDNDSYSNVISRTEYAQLNADPNNSSEEAYTTTYSYDSDPDRMIETASYPNGKRQDVKVYNPNSQLTSSYRHDVENNTNSLLEQYEYAAFSIPDRYEEYEYKIKKQINPQGGVTDYTYETDYPYLLSTRTDPNSGSDRQVTCCQYDGSRREILETRKASDGQLVYTSYAYDPTTGFLTSSYQGNDSVSAAAESRYNDFGQVIRQTNPDGVKTGKSYGQGGELVSEFTLAEGSDPNLPDSQLILLAQTKYTYTPDGKIEYLYRAKHDEQFVYNTPNAWIITKNEYDTLGRKKKIIEDYNGLNLTTEYFYTLQGEIEKVLYPTGKWVKTTHDGRGLIKQEITGFTNNGQDVNVLTTSYDYDADGNLKEQHNPDGTSQYYTYDNFDRAKRVYQNSLSGPYTEKFYNNAGDMEREIAVDVGGILLSDTRKGYDYHGRLLWQRFCAEPNVIDNTHDLIAHTIYDVAGNVRYTVKKDIGRTNFDPDPNDIVVEYRYDALGRKTKTIDPDGVAHTTYYTPAGLPEKIVDPNDPDDPDAFITRNYFDAAGRVEKTVNPEGHYTENIYNSLNQLTKQTVFDCNETPNNTANDYAVRQTRSYYDNLGNAIRQVVMKNPASQSGPVAGVDMITDFVYNYSTGLLYKTKTYYNTNTAAETTYYYDGIGRKIHTVDAADNEDFTDYYTLADGKPALVQKTRRLEKDPANSANNYTITTFFDYDNFGRLWKRILDVDGDGSKESSDTISTYLYDGLSRIRQEIAPDGIIRQSLYDGFGNAKQVIEDYNPQSSTALNKTTDYIYNRLNQLYKIKAYDPNDTTSNIAVQTTEYHYDKVGNIIQITYPDTKTVGYEYNLINKVWKETKRDGTAIYSWYDQLGNLTLVSDDEYADLGGNPTYKETLKYDAAGNLKTADKVEGANPISHSKFTYNGFGLKTSESAKYFTLSPVTTTWDYDGSGNLINQTLSTTTLSCTHDGLGRIKTIDRNGNRIVNYSYIGSSTKAIEYPEPQVSQRWSYDKLGRIHDVNSIDDQDNIILDFVYDYDEVGNRQSEEYHHLTTPIWDKYQYDNLRRLDQVDYAATSGFASTTQNRSSVIPNPLAGEDSVHQFSFLVSAAQKWLNEETNIATETSEYTEKQKENNYNITSVISVPSVANNIYSLAEFGTAAENNAKPRTETVYDDNGHIAAQIVYDTNGNMTLFAMYPDDGSKIVITSAYDNGTMISNICTTYDVKGNVVSREDMPLPTATTETIATMDAVIPNPLAGEEFYAQGTVYSATSSFSQADLWLLEADLLYSDSGMMLMSAPSGPSSRTQVFRYDNLDNRYQVENDYGLVVSTDTYAHNSVNQYLTKSTYDSWSGTSNYTMQHDDNGNLEVDEYGRTYFYDYRNRLIEVRDIDNNTIAEYFYDALGRRIAKTVGNTTTYFYYDTDNRVIAQYTQEQSQDVKPDRTFVYGNGFSEILAMFLYEKPYSQSDVDLLFGFFDCWLTSSGGNGYNDNYDYVNDNKIDLKDWAILVNRSWNLPEPATHETRFYYLIDALGSVRGLVGGRLNREEDHEFYNYDVYGATTDFSLAGNPFRFAGYRYDSETGLYHTKYRPYDPGTGRWLAFDPIEDTINLYEYARSNPTNWIDSLGLYTESGLVDAYVLAYGQDGINLYNGVGYDVVLATDDELGWDDYAIDDANKQILLPQTWWGGWDDSNEQAAKQLHEALKERENRAAGEAAGRNFDKMHRTDQLNGMGKDPAIASYQNECNKCRKEVMKNFNGLQDFAVEQAKSQIIAVVGAKCAGVMMEEIMAARAARQAEKIAEATKKAGQAVENAEKAAAKGPYSHLNDSKTVAPGKDFTQAQKKKIFEANRAKNNGMIRSDQSGTAAVPAQKHVKDVAPPTNEAHIDHIVPRSKGGTNSYSNAQVLTREENLSKGAN